MEGNYLNFLISFVVANLAIFLLLPNAYSSSTTLLEYIWSDNKKLSNRLTKKIEDYFSLTDLINYNTISFSLCMFVSGIVLISEQIIKIISINILRYIFFTLVIIYILWIILGIYRVKSTRKNIGGKGFKQGVTIIILTTLSYIIATNLWIFKQVESPTLILLYFMILSFHLFSMLLPLFYMPLSSVYIEMKNKIRLTRK